MRWIKGVIPSNGHRSDKIRRELGLENITLKARQERLRSYGHVGRMDEGNKLTQMMKMDENIKEVKEIETEVDCM